MKISSYSTKKRTIKNLDEAKYEEGYDSDGELPYYHDYSESDSESDNDGWDEVGERKEGIPALIQRKV